MPKQWCNSLKPAGQAAAALTLADKRKAGYSLVIPRDAQRIEVKAASDLAQNLKGPVAHGGFRRLL